MNAGDAPGVAHFAGLTGEGPGIFREMCPRFEGYLESDPLQAPHQSLGGTLGIAAIVNISTRLLVLSPVTDDVIGQHQNAMGHGHRGFLHPRMCRNSIEQRR